MSHGQVKEAEGAKAAAQGHAVARQEAQEKGQEVSIKSQSECPDDVLAYDAHDDAEAIKLWLWYR